MGFEESLIRNAAPTLAGIKVANLYNYRFRNEKDCMKSIQELNRQLNQKGIFIELMKHEGDFYLLYVYCKNQLSRILGERDTKLFLQEYGYHIKTHLELTDFIGLLRERLQHASDFPHEIGVFLGYPLEDVMEFINRKGEGCVLCGEWKAYHNVQYASNFFKQLQKCKDIYIKVYLAGRSLYDMTVNA